MSLPSSSSSSSTTTNLAYKLLPRLYKIIILFTLFYSSWDELTDMMDSMIQMNEDDTFDFIIVGAGSSGSVLANKLSENFKVLLLEAGGQSNPISSIPMFTFPMYWGIPEDWKYETVPQKYSGFALNQNILHWSAGKGLGGSSLINGMMFIRGSVQGFDVISKKTNDSIWRMDNVLKFYKKIEDYHGFYDDGSHGKQGGISVQMGYLNSFVDHLLRAGEELGYKIRDPNQMGPLTEGFSPMELFTKNGNRWSAFNGYIEPIMGKRMSLTIRKYSYAYKVILDEENIARGVEYLRHGSIEIVKANKEVILSAGAIQSPKILMLSGIGPKSHLMELGIPVKINLPVGENLQDKYGAVVGPFIVDTGNSYLLSRDFKFDNFAKYLLNNIGPLTTSQAEAIYTIKSSINFKDGRPKNENPNIHVYVLSIPMDQMLEDAIFTNALNFKPKFTKEYFRHAYGKEAFIQIVTISKPMGSGFLKLKDINPTSHILLDPNYLYNTNDTKTLVEGIKFSVKLVEETKSFKEIHGKLLPIPIPGCENHVFKSDDYWECLGRHTTATAYKYCSTAPIGKDKSDPQAVVDSRLRVLGTKNLRVIDASVLQERFVSVNHITCQMLGELASEFINEEYL